MHAVQFLNSCIGHAGQHPKRLGICFDVGTERAADLPCGSSLPEKLHMVEVMNRTDLIHFHCIPPGCRRQACVKRTVGIAGTSDKLGGSYTPDPKRCTADRTLTNGLLLTCAVHDVLTNCLFVCFQIIKDGGKHRP